MRSIFSWPIKSSGPSFAGNVPQYCYNAAPAEQCAVGTQNISRPVRVQHAIKTEFSAIEFAQCRGIGDGGATLQRRILCRTRRQSAVQQSKYDSKNSWHAAHAPTNTAQRGLFKKKGASHRREAPSCPHIVPSARDDQALAGYDHPTAVLLTNGVDT